MDYFEVLQVILQLLQVTLGNYGVLSDPQIMFTAAIYNVCAFSFFDLNHVNQLLSPTLVLPTFPLVSHIN